MTPPNHSLQTGDAELDGHHRELLALLGAAQAASARGDRPGAAGQLERFHRACLTHFQVEQRHLDALDGAAAQAHLESHAEFLDDLERLRAELRARGLTPLVRLWLSSRLVEWLRFHTRTKDVALVAAQARAAPPPGGATVTRLAPRAR
jgi:hemerythrin